MTILLGKEKPPIKWPGYEGRILPPPGHRLIKTQDGSWATYSERFQEATHAQIGAWAETQHNFIKATGLEELLSGKDDVRALEVGFGLGVGAACFWEATKACPQATRASFTSLEQDRPLAAWAWGQGPYRAFLREFQIQGGVEIILGDATETIQELEDDFFQVIFQDAFSPRKNPELWSESWFSQLHRVAQKGATLATFSSAPSVQKALHQAGWIVQKRPGLGPKRWMSVATKP